MRSKDWRSHRTFSVGKNEGDVCCAAKQESLKAEVRGRVFLPPQNAGILQGDTEDAVWGSPTRSFMLT